MKLKESEDEEDLEEESEDSEESDADESSEPAVETDNVGDPSVEINVEELIQELEVQDVSNRLGNEQAAKRRLEELMEQKRAKREIEDFEDYDI